MICGSEIIRMKCSLNWSYINLLVVVSKVICGLSSLVLPSPPSPGFILVVFLVTWAFKGCRRRYCWKAIVFSCQSKRRGILWGPGNQEYYLEIINSISKHDVIRWMTRSKDRKVLGEHSESAQEDCTVPQMIPKMDRKWSSTASDPLSRPQMIPWKLEEWNGFYGTDYKKGLIIKKEPFSLAC